MLGALRQLLEDHEGMGVQEMAQRAWDGADVGATGLARGRSQAIRPSPDEEAYEGKDGAANETLAIYFWPNCGTDVIGMSGVFVKPRWRYHNL